MVKKQKHVKKTTSNQRDFRRWLLVHVNVSRWSLVIQELGSFHIVGPLPSRLLETSRFKCHIGKRLGETHFGRFYWPGLFPEINLWWWPQPLYKGGWEMQSNCVPRSKGKNSHWTTGSQCYMNWHANFRTTMQNSRTPVKIHTFH